jgi:hypothetical protein
MIQSFDKPGMGGGASAPLPSGGIQGGSRPLQQNVQRMVPNPGQFNGNPRGVYNTNFQGQGNAPSYIQQTNLGRYTPPTMTGGNGQWNTNQWNNSGGSNYNLPGSYGSPAGQGQFAPMPGQFQQYMFPNQLSGNTFGFGNPFGQGMQQGGAPSRDDIYQQMIRQFGGGSPYQGGGGMGGRMSFSDPQNLLGQGRSQVNQFGFNQQQLDDDPRAFQEWAAQAMNAPGQDPQYAAQIRAQLEQMGGPMAPDKVGRPFPSRDMFRGRGADQGGPAPMPAYDRPENRAYNMQALREMMGGF